MTTDYNKTDGPLPTTRSRLDTIHRRHRVRFRSDHHTHQHTHCQHNFHKHHTDGRQAEHTKGQDAQQVQALARRHSMQNHTKKQHKKSKHLWSSSQTLKWGDNFRYTKYMEGASRRSLGLQAQHTHTPSIQLHPHTHHVFRPRHSDSTAGQMDGEAGWWTTSGKFVPPPHYQGLREWVDNMGILQRRHNMPCRSYPRKIVNIEFDDTNKRTDYQVPVR